MTSSQILIFLLFAFYLYFSGCQGIRLDKGFKLASHSKIQDNIDVNKARNNVMTKGGSLSSPLSSSGNKCKLVTSTNPPTTANHISENKSNKTDLLKAESNNGKRKSHVIVSSSTIVSSSVLAKSEHNKDNIIPAKFKELTDITEMDYSPATKNSPIHN